MNKKTNEQKFHENIIALGNLMIELISDLYSKGYKTVDPELCKMAVSILKLYNGIQMLENFIFYSYPYWDSILKREESYFILKASDIFSDLPSQSVDSFKILFDSKDSLGNHVIIAEDRGSIIDFFQSFVKISIPYIYSNHLDPKKVYKTFIIIEENGNKIEKEIQKQYNTIPIQEIAKKWGINLLK